MPPENRLRLVATDTAPHAPPASRASWIGTLTSPDFSLPIKAYAALASTDSHLHQIHAGCGQRVAYQKTCPTHGPLEAGEIGKAFDYAPDRLVELSSKELSELAPADDKTITIERYFSADHLDLTLLAGRTLLLAPANLAAGESFAVFQAALEQSRRWALGRTVFSQKRQLVVIHSQDQTLLLHTLHDPRLRRLPIPSPRSVPSRAAVRMLAKTLNGGDARIPWSDYSDETDQRLAALVAGKVARKTAGQNGRAKSRKTSPSQKPARSRKTKAA